MVGVVVTVSLEERTALAFDRKMYSLWHQQTVKSGGSWFVRVPYQNERTLTRLRLDY